MKTATDSTDRTDSPVRTVRTSTGARLSYATYGDPDGKPLVFFHGTPGSRLLGDLLDEAARKAGVQVVAPDRPGYGDSDPPSEFSDSNSPSEFSDTDPPSEFSDPDSPSEYDLSVAGLLTTTLADSVGAEQVAVAGFSGGGAYALAAAATAPERVRSVDVVSGVVPPKFVSDPPTVTRVLSRGARTTPTLLSWGFRAQAALAGVLPQGMVADQYTTESSPVEISEQVEQLVAADFKEAFAESATGTVTDFGLFSTPWNVEVESVPCPVRFWHGDADANAPIEGTRGLTAALPQADLTTFDAHGHLETLLVARTRFVEVVSRES